MSFSHSPFPEPHRIRRKQLIAVHPELQLLAGRNPNTFYWIVSLTIAQFGVAWALKDVGTGLVLLAAFGFGAFLNHGLFVLIHECTHNLVFRTSPANKIAALIANLPLSLPIAMGYRQYHLLHHSYKGDPELDGDIPFEWEAEWVGNSTLRKTLWLMFFFLIEGAIRPTRFRKKVYPHQSWVRENFLIQGAVVALLLFLAPRAELYLFASGFFAFGLHPLGGRWLQEHSMLTAGQETYSYYGPLNRWMFNAGCHHEHHDLPTVPWNRLPEIRRAAPELYQSLMAHTSYLRLLWTFLTDPRITLYCRVIRSYRREAIPEEKARAA